MLNKSSPWGQCPSTPKDRAGPINATAARRTGIVRDDGEGSPKRVLGDTSLTQPQPPVCPLLREGNTD